MLNEDKSDVIVQLVDGREFKEAFIVRQASPSAMLPFTEEIHH